jgi:HEAT repeat protein
VRAPLFFAAVVAASALGPATVSANPPTKAQVRAMLSGFEDVPTAAHFRALGPGALPVLIALYDDAREPGYVRMRAVAATAHFPTPATRTFLRAVARAPRQNDLFVREAVVALGRAFGERAIGDVTPFLESRHVTVREAAARTLGRIGTPRALDALRRRSLVEPDVHVRDVLARELR